MKRCSPADVLVLSTGAADCSGEGENPQAEDSSGIDLVAGEGPQSKHARCASNMHVSGIRLVGPINPGHWVRGAVVCRVSSFCSPRRWREKPGTTILKQMSLEPR